jgi:hypothetical protein
MIRLVEVVRQLERFDLREVFVNPRHVVSLREDGQTSKALNEGKLPEGMDPRQTFTKLTLDKGTVGLELTIVGSPAVVESKLKQQRQVLNG